MSDDVLLYLSLKPNPDGVVQLAQLMQRGSRPLDHDFLAGFLRTALKLSFTPDLRGVPSADFVLALAGVPDAPPMDTDTPVVFALEPLDPVRAAELIRKAAALGMSDPVREGRVGLDLPIGLAEAWCPREGSFPLFGDIDLALAQLRAEAAAAKGAYGQNVNVVIIDQGLNKDVLARRFPGADFRGGWKTPQFGKGGPPGPTSAAPLIDPGAWPDDGLGPKTTHATKMAELVLSVAPQARILDLALLPSRIVSLRSASGFQGYLSWALGALSIMAWQIPWIRRLFPQYSGPWVLNNSWAVYDLSTEPTSGLLQHYSSSPNNPVNATLALLPRVGIDVVFAAGNCGAFCPDGRCGTQQIGPGRSIYGVAALKDVLTVGAVRSDEIWLGYSSEGPAPPAFGAFKPDLCAPSQFAGTADWNRSFTGTSSACALVSGAIAAKRSLVPDTVLSPSSLRAHAVATSRRLPGQTVADTRLGAGMLDLCALLQ